MSATAFAGSFRGYLTPSDIDDRALKAILRCRLFISLQPNQDKDVFLQPQRWRCPARSIGCEAASGCCVSVTINQLADELVILVMRADSKTMYAAQHGDAKCAVVETYSDAMKSAICNSLEMQRWMTWIGLELSEIPVRYGLNFSGQCVEAFPKPP